MKVISISIEFLFALYLFYKNTGVCYGGQGPPNDYDQQAFQDRFNFAGTSKDESTTSTTETPTSDTVVAIEGNDLKESNELDDDSTTTTTEIEPTTAVTTNEPPTTTTTIPTTTQAPEGTPEETTTVESPPTEEPDSGAYTQFSKTNHIFTVFLVFLISFVAYF